MDVRCRPQADGAIDDLVVLMAGKRSVAYQFKSGTGIGIDVSVPHQGRVVFGVAAWAIPARIGPPTGEACDLWVGR
jgi:hypothetical protein